MRFIVLLLSSLFLSPIALADTTFIKTIGIPNDSKLADEPGSTANVFAVLVYEKKVLKKKTNSSGNQRAPKPSDYKTERHYSVLNFSNLKEHQTINYIQNHDINKKLFDHDPEDYLAYLHFFINKPSKRPAEQLLKVRLSRYTKRADSVSLDDVNDAVMDTLDGKYDLIGTLEIDDYTEMNRETLVGNDYEARLYVTLNKMSVTSQRRR